MENSLSNEIDENSIKNINALERLSMENSLSNEIDENSIKNINDYILGQEQIIIENPNHMRRSYNVESFTTLTPIYIMIFVSWLSPFIGGIYLLMYITCIRNFLDMVDDEKRAIIILFISVISSFIVNFIILN